MTREEVSRRGPALDDSHIRIIPQYLKICEENVAAAVVLWALQYCAISDGQGGTTWLTVTEAELHQRLCGIYSIPTIRAARRYLIQRRILYAARGACNSIKIRFNWDVVTALVDELAPPQVSLSGHPSVRKKLRTSQEKLAKQSERTFGLNKQKLADPLIGRKNGAKNSSKNQKNYCDEGSADQASRIADSTSEDLEAMLRSAIHERFGDLLLAGKPLEEATAKRIAEPIAHLPDTTSQKAVLEKLGRARGRRDIEWGWLVSEARRESAEILRSLQPPSEIGHSLGNQASEPPTLIPRTVGRPELLTSEDADRMAYSPAQIESDPLNPEGFEKAEQEMTIDMMRGEHSSLHREAVKVRWRLPGDGALQEWANRTGKSLGDPEWLSCWFTVYCSAAARLRPQPVDSNRYESHLPRSAVA